MFATAATLSAATTVGTLGVPYFHLGSFDKLGIPIQAFGVIVAIGVLIGAALLRRYAEWHGVSDDHIRGLTGWITVSGFIGAHVFDVVAYQWDDLVKDPVLLIKLWKGISSYGGFLGGAIGFALYVWWKRLPARLMADIAVVGLLPAFSIGRIGCSVVSDHLGARANPDAWYSFLSMRYPYEDGLKDGVSGLSQLFKANPDAAAAGYIEAWNLGLVELFYLIPVNLLILWLAFRPSKRLPAGILVVMTGMFYAPVRFFMDYLRPENSDPRHLGLTFAQWASVLAFGVSIYAASRILRGGKAAETVTRTSGEAQAKLKVLLHDDDDDKKAKMTKVDPPKKRPLTDSPDDERDDPATDDDVPEVKVRPGVPAADVARPEVAKPASEMAEAKEDAVASAAPAGDHVPTAAEAKLAANKTVTKNVTPTASGAKPIGGTQSKNKKR
ncbi:MAG: prolipoprotein diacylglyceryl transferase family protein [Kofleriaceae bacterium]